MIFESWISSLNLMLGTTTEQSAILMSFICLLGLSVLVLISMGKDSRKLESLLFIDVLGILLFLYMGWLPIMLGVVLAVIFAGIGAYIARDWLGGRV